MPAACELIVETFVDYGVNTSATHTVRERIVSTLDRDRVPARTSWRGGRGEIRHGWPVIDGSVVLAWEGDDPMFPVKHPAGIAVRMPFGYRLEVGNQVVASSGDDLSYDFAVELGLVS